MAWAAKPSDFVPANMRESLQKDYTDLADELRDARDTLQTSVVAGSGDDVLKVAVEKVDKINTRFQELVKTTKRFEPKTPKVPKSKAQPQAPPHA